MLTCRRGSRVKLRGMHLLGDVEWVVFGWAQVWFDRGVKSTLGVRWLRVEQLDVLSR